MSESLELISDAITDAFSNGDKNACDAIDRLADRIVDVANSIAPVGAIPGQDAAGGHVTSLTESCMGITAGLMAIASAIETLADAIRSTQPA